tara:strand:- start:539 stop:1159 length:621 start_codon:yes stop_codon:yes gene_type:complete
MAEEPRKLKSIKEILSLFKTDGIEKLLLKLKGMKQGAEYTGAKTKMNLMNLIGEGGFTDEAEGFTEEDFERQAALLDSLGTEKAKTDSLLNILGQDVFEGSNVETESDFDVQEFMMDAISPGGAVGKVSKTVLANKVSGKLGLGKGGTQGIKDILTESDMDLLNTTFGRRSFFNIIRGFKEGLIDRNNNAYGRAQRFMKLYEKFFN